uniref:Trehalase n=1 Tax=Nothobranchius furzeri TaxID=105023 RepID=A0A8C6KTT0_NOTFU
LPILFILPADVVSAFPNLSQAFPNASIPPREPKFLKGIADDKLQKWGEEIHNLWKSLGRKIRSDFKDHPEFYSQIYTPHPMVVPRGHFRGTRDSYWVINGLLLSEMTNTAHGMIQNFLYLVNRYGFVPNGGRIYYERRSQSPFFTLMVQSFYEATEDKEFLREALPFLEKEYQFWMQTRSVALKVNGSEHVLNQYSVQVGFPRPESYSDDVELAEGLSDEHKAQLWMDMTAGAESGWDFISRWYIDADGHNNSTLRETQTSQILPSDLNALLCRCEKTLASFHRLLGGGDSAARYQQIAARRIKAMEDLLWDAEKGAWFDYSLVTHSKHFEFYPSNLAPVWAQCYSHPEMAEKAVRYLEGSGTLEFPNGVPPSLRESGQQWDYPNAWPPLHHMLIEGLSKLPSDDAKQLAFDLAQRWIRTNWLAYIKYEAMFEKVTLSKLPKLRVAPRLQIFNLQRPPLTVSKGLSFIFPAFSPLLPPLLLLQRKSNP